MTRSNAVILYAHDGYDVGRAQLMGRHMAGAGFLRAAVSERVPGPLHCYATTRGEAEGFARAAQQVDPTVECRWINGANMGDIAAASGVLYIPDPQLAKFARGRLRTGMAGYSLCGVTHTTANPGTMQLMADALTAPVAPWDALICTSAAVLQTVQALHEAEADMLRWRFGADARITAPQLPVIPLGVHCDDFVLADGERERSREALGLESDEVVALFVGRLSFSSKQHPLAMYEGLQAAAERTGKRVTLVMCGWYPNPTVTPAFTEAPARFCPDVRVIVVDGREPEGRRRAWAAADLFVTLSDNIQETFGLTPVEAMAAGLPCVVTDWNGYRDTVRDGVDGFRVRTWMPTAGVVGEAIARENETEETDYSAYVWTAALGTSVDMRELTERLSALISDPDLRRAMGEAGRARARAIFDWPHVIRAYQELWGDLNQRRAAGARDQADWIGAAPKCTPARADPFALHAHYASNHIASDTVVRLYDGASVAAFAARKADLLFRGARINETIAAAALERLAAGPASVAELAAAAGLGAQPMLYLAGILAKMKLVAFEPPPSSPPARVHPSFDANTGR